MSPHDLLLPLANGRLCGPSSRRIGKAAYYSLSNGRMILDGRKRHEHEQSPVLVSSKALRMGLGLASCLAGMGVFFRVDHSASRWPPFAATG